jgi:hypothetical protein
LQAWARGDRSVLFDLTRRALVELPKWGSGWFVRGRVAYQHVTGGGHRAWSLVDADGEHPVDALRGCHVQGLADDDHLLCAWSAKNKPMRLFLLRVADLTTTDVPLPPGLPPGAATFGAVGPLHGWGSLLPRDPAGRIWLTVGNGTDGVWLRLDPASRAVEAVLPYDRRGDSPTLLGWPDAYTVLLRDGATIQRVNVATGARTQLFPRR